MTLRLESGTFEGLFVKKATHTFSSVDFSRKPVVGASGYIGKASLGALVSRHGSTVDMYAGVRDPSKFGTMDGAQVVEAAMGNKVGLTKALQGFDSVYLIIPGHEQHTALGLSGLDAVQDAGMKFLCSCPS
jgi:putative NADH-flavin reductase